MSTSLQSRLVDALKEADRRLQTLLVFDVATYDQQPQGTPSLASFHKSVTALITEAETTAPLRQHAVVNIETLTGNISVGEESAATHALSMAFGVVWLNILRGYDYGALTAYLLRRFGPPNVDTSAWDHYKHGAVWIVPTAHENESMRPASHSAGGKARGLAPTPTLNVGSPSVLMAGTRPQPRSGSTATVRLSRSSSPTGARANLTSTPTNHPKPQPHRNRPL